MSIKEQDGALHWSWRGMFAAMIHRHYETFELPEVPDRLLPDRLPITFLTDREGNIVSLSAPLEPMAKDIVFVLRATARARLPGRGASEVSRAGPRRRRNTDAGGSARISTRPQTLAPVLMHYQAR
jgi:hypothetical protein